MSNNDGLTITISGATKSGKTMLVQILATYLSVFVGAVVEVTEGEDHAHLKKLQADSAQHFNTLALDVIRTKQISIRSVITSKEPQDAAPTNRV